MTAVAPDPTNSIEGRLITPIAELGRGGMATAYLVSMQQPNGLDELMVVTNTHDGADRLRSYRLLAEALDATPGKPVPARSGTAVA